MTAIGVADEQMTASNLSVFDMFRLGPGPSSSHTVGPLRAGYHFAATLLERGIAPQKLRVELYGSLAATGIGHGTNRAVLLGLAGAEPATVTTEEIEQLLPRVAATRRLPLMGGYSVPFDLLLDLVFEPSVILPFHVNSMRITASSEGDDTLLQLTYYSTGGGFVSVQENGDEPWSLDEVDALPTRLPHRFTNGADLLKTSEEAGLSIAQVVEANEQAARPQVEIDRYVAQVADTMFAAIEEGCSTEGILPGGLGVPRRAQTLREKLVQSPPDPLILLDWVTLYALAVNEQNAAGHLVVTAPTNGAAGIVPAVLGYYLVTSAAQQAQGLKNLEPSKLWKLREVGTDLPDRVSKIRDYLLTASAVGAIIKTNASIAGAEVGCQGEVGSASAMAAAGLAQVMGGSPAQVENAAEIAMEHSLGLTCDPVGGLVQIPCIERNAIGAVKAISAARMALYGDGRHQVPLDVAVETMRQTGVDMLDKYKETSVGGLAVNVVEC